MSHKHFTLLERIKLEGFLDEKISIVVCAKKLDKNPSSIHAEIKRNRLTKTEFNRLFTNKHSANKLVSKNNYYYIGELAHEKALQRRYRANTKHLKLTNENTPISITIERLIRRRWSPEQISHCMKLGRVLINGNRPKVIIAVQTIYDWIYRFHKELKKFLRHIRGYRHNREYYINKKARKERQLEKGIDNRPEIVVKRQRIGDFEGDTVVGKDHGATGRIGTLVDRRTRYLIAFLLPPLTAREQALPEDEKELNRLTMSIRFADEASYALRKKIKTRCLHTLTLDNGTENNGYEWIERDIPCLKVYFAHPYHSWERGTNENTNGLLRQYFPKGMDFRKITQAMLDKAVTEINNRPRKCLNWMSPREKMSQNHALVVNKKSCDLK